MMMMMLMMTIMMMMMMMMMYDDDAVCVSSLSELAIVGRGPRRALPVCESLVVPTLTLLQDHSGQRPSPHASTPQPSPAQLSTARRLAGGAHTGSTFIAES